MKSWIEVSAGALGANFRAVQRVVGPGFEVLGVIKADAYGHGAALCAPGLAAAGARWLGVGDLEEGVRVREALGLAGFGADGVRLLVMCGFSAEDAEGLVSAELTPVVWTPEHVAALEAAAEKTRRRVRVHLEIDTGMARQGAVAGTALEAVLTAVRQAHWVLVEGVFSHLSSSEVVDSAETARQWVGFEVALKQVFAAGVMPELVHLGNSSGVDEGSSTAWVRGLASRQGLVALVRPGLALYGYVLPLEVGGSDIQFSEARPGAPGSGALGLLAPALEPVATWKTRVVGVRQIGAGETVGYGATFVAERGMRVALLPVGYADGFRREASSGMGDGWVVIGGQRAAVVGRVSMNLMVVNVSEFAPAVEVGDEVVLLGPGVTAADHARWCGTIPYEILCGMRGERRLV